MVEGIAEGRKGLVGNKDPFGFLQVTTKLSGERDKNERKIKAFKVKPDVEYFILGRDIIIERAEWLSEIPLVGQ